MSGVVVVVAADVVCVMVESVLVLGVVCLVAVRRVLLAVHVGVSGVAFGGCACGCVWLCVSGCVCMCVVLCR